MISKQELLETAAQLNLGPHVVEKDYALGWVLAGIYNHEKLASDWVFKGGTCLKKCFFETYRFSEDLDFTLKDESHLDAEFLEGVFAEIAEWVYEQCGLELPDGLRDFDIHENPRGNLSCQGKISYRGPVSPRSGGLPRVKLDLTADERLVLPPVRLLVFHPYSDAPEGGIEVLSYAYEEAFGEKVRALAERTRPRDLYDVINLFRNTGARPTASVILDVLKQKCEFKGIAVPVIDDLRAHRPDLESAWGHMLGHQLPELPPVEAFWNALPEFFAWLLEGVVPAAPAAYALGGGETIVRERLLRLSVPRPAQSSLEVVRFAAANHLCVDLNYQGSTHRIEPYSLRQTRDGNIILHAWNVDKDQHRSYRVDRIQGAQTTSQGFVPRYEIELTPSGPVAILPTARTSTSTFKMPRGATKPAHQSTRSSFGPAYIYQCGVCGKKFRRTKQTSSLSAHKAPGGYPCMGRMAMLVNTRY